MLWNEIPAPSKARFCLQTLADESAGEVEFQ